MGLTQKLGTIPLAIQTDSSNNIGIGGAANASYKLAVTGASLFSSSVTAGARVSGITQNSLEQFNAGGLTAFSNGNAFRYIQIGYDNAGNYGWIQSLEQGTAYRNLILNGAGGNVGIGTSSITSYYGFDRTLSVENASSAEIQLKATGGTNTLASFGAATNGTYLQSATQPLITVVNGTERMRITSGGNVLIGTTSNPSNYKFVVNSTAYVPQFIAFGVNDDGRYIGQGNQISGAFQANDIAIVNYAPTNTRIVIANYSTGVALNNGATSWSSFSDERLKNITGNIENAVDKLLSIRAVNYSWKTDETNKENLGLIAQDVEKVFPQVIDESKSFNEGDDTEYLSIRYSELIPVLVKAIQELNAKVTALENK